MIDNINFEQDYFHSLIFSNKKSIIFVMITFLIYCFRCESNLVITITKFVLSLFCSDFALFVHCTLCNKTPLIFFLYHFNSCTNDKKEKSRCKKFTPKGRPRKHYFCRPPKSGKPHGDKQLKCATTLLNDDFWSR